MSDATVAPLTRRDVLRAGSVAAAGYCLAAEPVLAQAIKTDTTGIQAGDATVKSGVTTCPCTMPSPRQGRRRRSS
jgi:carboxymethylenebutenolidase